MDELSQRARDAVDRCPHCGNRTGLEVAARLRYRCRICGGPRVPIVGEHEERSNREAPQLEKAKRAHRAHFLYAALAVATGIAGGVSFIATLLTLWAISGVTTAWATLLLLPSIPLLLAFWAKRRSTRAAEQSQEALDAAWASVAYEFLAARTDEMTSGQLADHLLSDEQHVERLLAHLSVDDQVRSRITDDGQLAYSVRAPQRLRIASGEPVSGYADTQLLETQDALAFGDTALVEQVPGTERAPLKSK